jgi:hypothetical protein
MSKSGGGIQGVMDAGEYLKERKREIKRRFVKPINSHTMNHFFLSLLTLSPFLLSPIYPK